MTAGDPVPAPPDPPGKENPTAFMPQTRKHGESKQRRQPTNTTPTPLQPPSSQSQDRLRVSGLAEFEAGKARKRQATAGPEDHTRRPDPTFLGTPRSVRFKNLFSDSADPPNLLDVTRRLYDLIDISINLPNKGAKRVTIGSESAADVKTLMARLLKLVELQDNIPSFR